MNKQDFINKLAEKYEITKKEASVVVERFNSTLEECLVDGDKVSFVGLYQMGTKIKKARQGVNPRSGETMTIPEMRVPYCKFGKNLKEEIR